MRNRFNLASFNLAVPFKGKGQRGSVVHIGRGFEWV